MKHERDRIYKVGFSSNGDDNTFNHNGFTKIMTNTATYKTFNQELALTKANICSPELKRAVKKFSGERYIKNDFIRFQKSFC